MASSLFRIRESGQDVNTLRPCSPYRFPASHRPPIQLPPLKSNWDPSFDNSVADYSYDPYSAPDIHSLFFSSVRDYCHHMGENHRYSYHNTMMCPRRGHQTSPPTPQLLRGSFRDCINTVYPAPPSTYCNALPEYGYAKPSQAPLLRFPGTLPATHGVPMHAHHYHEQQYHDPAKAAYAASQGHMAPQILTLAPLPVTTVRVSGTKRYRCRYAKPVGCEKTFTSSGHASRHSKIHTSETVPCAFPGCPKRFIRADNMKQHFETHSRDPRRPRPFRPSTGSSSRRTLHTNASASAVAIRHKRRGPSRNMVRLRARQMHQVNTEAGNKGLA